LLILVLTPPLTTCQQRIENLDRLVNLEELWLGKNKIAKLEVCIAFATLRSSLRIVQGMEALKKLKILSIQSNRIAKLEGLEELESLEQLYLSHNGIKKIEGLERNVSQAKSSSHRQRDNPW
jgi:protein phosphatase 1 regulatory subunit 7